MPTPQAPTYAMTRSRASSFPALVRDLVSVRLRSVSKRFLRGTVADPASDLGHDHAWLDGLGEIGAEADLRCALPVVGQRVRRQRDDRYGMRARIAAQDTGGFPTVQARDRDI